MTQNLKFQNDAKVARLNDAKKITQLILEKNRNDKERKHKKTPDHVTNQESRLFGSASLTCPR